MQTSIIIPHITSEFFNSLPEFFLRNFNVITIGLTADRETIYNRINKRVDILLHNGLLNEVKGLKTKQHFNALNTVGYKELFKHLNGEWTLDLAISETKKNTRRFAKRQLTWFKKDKSILWFDHTTDSTTIIEKLKNKFKTYLNKLFYKTFKNKKVLIIHGKNDGAIELKYSLAGKNLMEKLGMETQYIIKERGHGQAPDFYEIVESWLK